jgi:hypothetical protein
LALQSDIRGITDAYVQIRYNYLLIYHVIDYDRFANTGKRHDITQYSTLKTTYNGNSNVHVKRRINHAINKILIASPCQRIFNPVTNRYDDFTINFITLTIPTNERMIDAKEGYEKLLKPFLRKMRDKYHLRTYIWKAEVQKRGQLHYHITTNTWIHYQSIRDEWNNILYRCDFMNEYIKEHKNYSPNSTDVHKVYKIKDIAAYLSKYISKDVSDSTSLNSKIWDCSNDIKCTKLPATIINDNIDAELLSMIKSKRYDKVDTEHCTLIKPIVKSNEITLFNNLKKVRDEYINNFQQIETLKMVSKDKNKCNVDSAAQ